MSVPLATSSIKQEFLTELESIIESDEAYGSNIQVLTYSIKDEVINGKFKDSWNNRVYEFIIDVDGVSYKPAAKLDSFGVDELPARFDAFSEGYSSLFVNVRLDRNLTGKRVKKPKCGAEGYGCGFSCIGLQKICRVLGSGKKAGANQGSAIGKERLTKLVELARKYNSEGDKDKTLLTYNTAKNIKDIRDKYRSAAKNKPPILSNKEFKAIGNDETRQKLNQWIETNKELNELNERRGVKGIDKKRTRAATEIVESLFDMMNIKDADFSGVVDSEGRLQAAYISRETDTGYYVDFLASAPWNSLSDHPNKKTGAGASAMEAVIRTATKKNKGQINLESTSSAVPFYEKVGFRKKKGGAPGYPDMELTADNAKNFLKTQEDKYRQDTTQTTPEPLTELEQLEEEALGLFTIPQEVHKKVIKRIESNQG